MTRAVTPGRRFFPGHWDHNERAVPDTQILEMDLAIGPDDKRVIQPPVRTPEDDAAIARARRMAVVVAVATFSALAALLGIADARWQP